MHIKSFVGYSGILMAFVVLSGCASIKEGARTDAEIVAERSQQRLDALLAGDLEGAWRFTTPAHRQANPPGHYTRHVGGAGDWTAAEVRHVSCEDERCVAQVRLSYRIRSLNVVNTRPVEEVWIKVDDQWWIYHR